VVLFADVFNDQFFPQTLRSAVDVLETVGYHVIVPGAPPAVRPLIHYGMLGLAARRLERIVAMMRPFADAGIPIVGLEPSTVSVLRDELPSLLPHDADAKLLSGMAMLLSELLDRDEVELPSLARRVVFHGHCHQKAVLNKEAALRLLRRMGAEIVEPEPGCCGMAGSFGYEAEHYDVSQAVAEQHLLPTVREAPPGALVVVEGFSCREQIAQGTGRRPMHVAEAIDLAIREARRRGQTTGVSRAPEPPSPPLWRTGAAAEVEHRT
jgi:Fe-S oxidoreductase